MPRASGQQSNRPSGTATPPPPASKPPSTVEQRLGDWVGTEYEARYREVLTLLEQDEIPEKAFKFIRWNKGQDPELNEAGSPVLSLERVTADEQVFTNMSKGHIQTTRSEHDTVSMVLLSSTKLKENLSWDQRPDWKDLWGPKGQAGNYLTQTSRYLSWALRHDAPTRPDANGFVDLRQVIEAKAGRRLLPAHLVLAILKNFKQRFQIVAVFQGSGSLPLNQMLPKIRLYVRATQGHGNPRIAAERIMEELSPAHPDWRDIVENRLAVHCTQPKAAAAILRDGVLLCGGPAGKRNDVHFANPKLDGTGFPVSGGFYWKPIHFILDTRRFVEDGNKLYRSVNGVIVSVGEVSTQYLLLIDITHRNYFNLPGERRNRIEAVYAAYVTAARQQIRKREEVPKPAPKGQSTATISTESATAEVLVAFQDLKFGHNVTREVVAPNADSSAEFTSMIQVLNEPYNPAIATTKLASYEGCSSKDDTFPESSHMSALRRDLRMLSDNLEDVPVERLTAVAFAHMQESPRFVDFMSGKIVPSEAMPITDANETVRQLIKDDPVFAGVLTLTLETAKARGELELRFSRQLLAASVSRLYEQRGRVDDQADLEHSLTDLEHYIWSQWYIHQIFYSLKVEENPAFERDYFSFARCAGFRAQHTVAALLFRLFERKEWHTLSVFAECVTCWK